MKEFITAAKEAGGEVDEDDVITTMHDGKEVTFYKPGTGQQAMMLQITRRKMDPETAGTFIALIFEMMEPDTRQYFEQRLMTWDDSFDLEGEGGLVEIFEYLMEEWSARPTKQPSDYQPPQRATGKQSTASTRAKGSTSSRSRSRASSR